MTEIESLIAQYNIDPRNIAIKHYYEADNLWKALRIERDENKHSAYLAWLLKRPAKAYNSPMINFLNLLVKQADDCNISEPEIKRLRSAILRQSLVIKNIEARTEMPVCSLSKIRYTDRLDLFFECDIVGVEPFNKLEIILENKIDSSEGVAKNQNRLLNPTIHELAYKAKSQTERYYYACSKEYGNRNESFNSETTLQLFVFLTSRIEQNPAENKFIKINYQDLTDFILEPYSKQEDIDEHTRISINEYLHILGNPYYSKMSTMAITTEERELLIDFFQRNEALFRKAIEVMISTSDSEEEENNYRAMLSNIAKTTKARRFFVINNGNIQYKMYEIVAKFVQFRLAAGDTMDTIDGDISIWTKENVCHVSFEKNKVRRSEKCFESRYEDSPFYVTKEWGLNDNGRNFSGFEKEVNKQYPNFQIAIV